MEQQYVRLPGRRYSSMRFSRSSLWLGTDHLLHVINRGYTEEYKRFDYRDIQALMIRATSTGTILSIILGVIAGINIFILALGRFVWSWSQVALIPLAISSGFWALCFLLELAAGPTCSCYLRTAVQFEQLPSLFRVRKAHKAIDLLRARIENVQGVVTQGVSPP